MSDADELSRRWGEVLLEMGADLWERLREAGEPLDEAGRVDFLKGFSVGAVMTLMSLAESGLLYELDDDLRPQPISVRKLGLDVGSDDSRDPAIERLIEIVVDDREGRRQAMPEAFLRRLQSQS